ncbi:MAG: ABC transporter ATP-binding protein [Crocinitomicaceae bacterium]|nr:ABC transporter ATP-binding protein [Crocinitomicaceae bacterium]
MEEPILQVVDLNLAYDDKRIIRNCSLEIKEGENLVILGASGAGKSTLLKAIAGLSPHQSGEIYFQGEQVVDAFDKLIPGHDKIKLINQDFGLDEYHTVEENIRLRLLQYTKEYQRQRLAKMLRLTGLTSFKEQRAKDLSGGQKQRLSMARALADEPELILLDEPFNQVDFKTKTRLTKHLRSYLKNSKTTMIMVTHNGQEALEWGDKIAFIKNGKIKRIDAAENFYAKPSSLEEALFFGTVNKMTIENKPVYFRPGDWKAVKTKKYSLKVKVEVHSSQALGWFYSHLLKIDGNKIEVYGEKKLPVSIYIRPLSF